METPRVTRRLVITVCPREPGSVTLPVRAGEASRPLDAAALTRALAELVAQRGLEERVTLRKGCAGGCGQVGPNVGVTIHPATRPGARPDHVAIAWKTYVYSLATLDCLAAIIDDNLYAPT